MSRLDCMASSEGWGREDSENPLVTDPPKWPSQNPLGSAYRGLFHKLLRGQLAKLVCQNADFSCAQQTAAGHGFFWLEG
eukprot:1161379-Pelagomonas_calceolata.AAC.7